MFDFENIAKMFDYKTMADNVEKAQKQYFDSVETAVKAQNKMMLDAVSATKSAVNNFNGEVAKAFKK